MKNKRITLIVLSVLLAGTVSACQPRTTEEIRFIENPESAAVENAWEFDTPENQGADSVMIEDFYSLIEDYDVSSVVVVKGGKIISEYYKREIIESDLYDPDTRDRDEGYNENSLFEVYSVSKSILSALVGIAIDQGHIPGTDTKIAEYFPQLADDPQKKEVTIGHLLTHTSGFVWNDDDHFIKGLSKKDAIEFFLGCPMVDEPGTIFRYNTCATHILSAILQIATGKDAYTFACESLFFLIGMESVHWKFKDDIALGGTGVQMSARDMARFGRLFLNGGKWQGRQIIPEEWVRESTRSQTYNAEDAPDYGYLWWVSSEYGQPYYEANGLGGQYIFVVPEMDLVTVMTGWDSGLDLESCFRKYIIESCTGS